jgi:DNA-binding protein WhiA
MLDKEGLKGGLVKRRSSHVAYLKDADEIAEFLRLTGAFQAVLDYENIRARKSLMSSVLRVVNMDRANVSRAVEASIKQLGDIRLIDEEIGLSRLPHALRELARARLEHPDLTMEELGQLLVPQASKSAVNHRFRRIAEIADGLRKEKDGEPESPA